MANRGGKQLEKEAESSSQPQESGETGSASKALIKQFLEQQKAQQEQQRLLMTLVEQQKDEIVQNW